ncbi:MAG TPA: isoprenylcysteine carboxylmethyltransferase family protein [Candidatus Binatia bacterium]
MVTAFNRRIDGYANLDKPPERQENTNELGMTEKDNAGVVAPPPLLYGGGLIVVLVLRWLQPMPIFGPIVPLWPSLALAALGVGIAIWGMRTLLAAGTNVNPSRPTTAIVHSGPYRFSRNPLYVALTLFYSGLTLALDTWWGFIALVPILVLMHCGVVLREERYLERKFGENYRQYRSKVRRYL